tara:strand:- start:3542 stop:4027 length:486 start_codon:yes stop_codon:yes gene_type:complete
MSNVILNSNQIVQKIKRLSYELYENNLEEKKVILFGINSNGNILSNRIKKNLDNLFPVNIESYNLKIDVNNSTLNKLDLERDSLNGKVIIIVDDVLNSGKTIAYSINLILPFYPKKIEVAVLVDRSHKNFPILAKYSGVKLNTTINEHVKIDFKKNKGYLL